MKLRSSSLRNSGPRQGVAQFLQRLTPRRVARKIWRTIYQKDYVDYRGMRLPLRDDRRVMSGEAFGSDEWFLQSGIVEALRLSARMGYNSDSKILDIGSGLGRLATGLLWEFGNAAHYLGLEVNREHVAWCMKHIEALHPNYRFVHVDVSNERYNPEGKLKGADKIRLPVGDEQLDIVYLWGVFTNMGPEEILIYITEISCMLKPGGKCFLTAFVENGVPDVSFNPQGYGPYEYDGSPLFAARYSYDFLVSAFIRHRLKLDEFRLHGGGFPYHSEIYLSKV